MDVKQPYVRGANFCRSKIYHNRWECRLWGKRGREIKYWIRDTFGDTDDLVWASNDDIAESYSALITAEQLTLVLLRWQ